MFAMISNASQNLKSTHTLPEGEYVPLQQRRINSSQRYTAIIGADSQRRLQYSEIIGEIAKQQSVELNSEKPKQSEKTSPPSVSSSSRPATSGNYQQQQPRFQGRAGPTYPRGPYSIGESSSKMGHDKQPKGRSSSSMSSVKSSGGHHPHQQGVYAQGHMRSEQSHMGGSVPVRPPQQRMPAHRPQKRSSTPVSRKQPMQPPHMSGNYMNQPMSMPYAGHSMPPMHSYPPASHHGGQPQHYYGQPPGMGVPMPVPHHQMMPPQRPIKPSSQSKKGGPGRGSSINQQNYSQSQQQMRNKQGRHMPPYHK